MIKVVASFKRKAGSSVEDFQRYWHDVHGPLAAELPGLRRYVQCHTLHGGYRKGEPVYDGVAEVWFDDTEALRKLAGHPAFKAVQEDEPRFMDVATMAQIVTDDHLVKDGPIPEEGVKNIEFVSRRPDLDVPAFQKHWREIHGPLGASIPQVKRYVQSHTRASAYTSGKTPRWDGVALTWFEDTKAMRASAETAEYETTRRDEPNFVAAELPFLITRERVIVDGPAF